MDLCESLFNLSFLPLIRVDSFKLSNLTLFHETLRAEEQTRNIKSLHLRVQRFEAGSLPWSDLTVDHGGSVVSYPDHISVITATVIKHQAALH